jgi:hypothetical protein
MRITRTLLMLLAACTLFMSSGAVVAAAQVTAQEGGEQSAPPVPVAGEDGTVVGSITVTDVVDPFLAFNPDYPPEPGTRIVMATVVVDADTGQRFDFVPWNIVLRDDLGFTWDTTSVFLPDDALIPELTSQTLAPGSRVTGLVGFAVPEGNTPTGLYYQPVYNRLVPLVSLAPVDAPALGEAVPIADSQGGTGTVTVAEIVDPFEQVDPSYPAPDGQRYVMVSFIFENPEDDRFSVEPYGLVLQDANGELWSSTYVARTDTSSVIPDLGSIQLAPGDRITGALIFAVPADAALEAIYLSPASGQLIQLAGLTEREVPMVTPRQPEAGEQAVVAADSDDPCVQLDAWQEATRNRIQRARALSAEVATSSDLAVLAESTSELAAIAEEQLAEAVPVEAEAVNKAIVATLRAYASAVPQLTDAAESGGDASDEIETMQRADDRLVSIEGELDRLAAECGLE